MTRTLLLIVPPQAGLLEGFSNGLVALANFVSIHEPRVDVRLLDLSITPSSRVAREISDVLRDVSSELFVGITTTTASYQSALRTAKIFKSFHPSCAVVFGGHHATAQDDVILNSHFPLVDFVIRGEGEIALVELLRHYPELSAVPGLSYLRGTCVQRNPSAPLLDQEDLNALSPTFDGHGPRSAPGKFEHVTYVSARGCPLKCAFCSVANQSIRAKSVSCVTNDIRHLLREHGCRKIAIEDNFFAHSPRRTLELCEALAELQREVPFSWDCQTRIESMRRPDILAAMEKAGCEAVYLGVEAFHPDQLVYLGKTASPGNYLRMLEQEVIPGLLKSGVDCYLNIQVGIPGEEFGEEDLRLQVLRRLGEQAVSNEKTIRLFPQMHVVYPGTRHFHDGLADGRWGPDGAKIFERFTEWEIRQEPVVKWLGEHFAHGTGGLPIGILCRDKLRRGDFDVDVNAILRIVTALEAMDNLCGIEVFKFGKYLVPYAEAAVQEIAGNGSLLEGIFHEAN